MDLKHYLPFDEKSSTSKKYHKIRLIYLLTTHTTYAKYKHQVRYSIKRHYNNTNIDYIHNYMLLLTCKFKKWIVQLIKNINMYVLMNATMYIHTSL